MDKTIVLSPEKIKNSKPITSIPTPKGVSKVYKEEHKGFFTAYKPYKGEPKGMRDTIKGSLYKREVLAYEVDQFFKFGIVPPTVIAHGAKGIGSRQLWVDGKEDNDVDSVKKRVNKTQLAKMVLFDFICMNTDRHSGNWLYDTKKKKLWAIDNGLCFSYCNCEFRCEILDSTEIDRIRDGECDILKKWMNYLPENVIKHLKTLDKNTFLSMFKKYRFGPAGLASWNRLQKVLNLKKIGGKNKCKKCIGRK